MTPEQAAAIKAADDRFAAAKNKAIWLPTVYLAGQAMAKARAEREDAYCDALGRKRPDRGD